MQYKKTIIFLILGIAIGLTTSTIAQLSAHQDQLRISGKDFDLQTIVQHIKKNYVPKWNYESYERFNSIYNLLQTHYYDTGILNQQSMLDEAIKAYVNAIEDPYTIYFDNQTNISFQQDLKGESDLEGIGAVVNKKDTYILIEEVLKNSPAAKAELRPLDRIIAIDGTGTRDLTLEEAVSYIRGPQGSTVTLIIDRPLANSQELETIEIIVTRDKLVIPSVTSKVIENENDRIGYINISVIGQETERILQETIVDFQNQNIEGIILDLRGNGGGFLPIAVEISSHFIPKDKLIVSAQYRGYPDEIYKSAGYNDLSNKPVIVLVDYLTASAGEIIALALQEQIAATIVGTTTFGKWSIQTLHEFNDGDAIKYTIGKWFSPSGKSIDKIGIIPDIVVEFDADSYEQTQQDNQLQEAINTISTQIP